MRDYIFTDLACEKESNGGDITRLGENILMKKSDKVDSDGENVAFFTPKIWDLSCQEFDVLSKGIARELCGMMNRVNTDAGSRSVLVAGLGNGDLTPDSLGPETVKRITVTRHLFSDERKSLRSRAFCRVSAIIPGVLANTGIETVELLKGAVSRVRPDVVLAIDSLAARSPKRLAATVQLSDLGIAPGSGIGNHRKSITAETLGVPVIAIGVPVVIHSTTLVRDALEQNGFFGENANTDFFRELSGFFVTPKETDLLIKSAAVLLADGIDRACTVGQE